MKLLEEKLGGNLLVIGLGDDFLDLTPKAKATKVKTNTNNQQVGLHQAKKFLLSKGNHEENEKAAY